MSRSEFDPLGHRTDARDLAALHDLAMKVCEGEPLDSVGVEVGSWAGQSALALSDVLDVVYCVDHWQGTKTDRLGELPAHFGGPKGVFQAFCRNMGPRLMRKVFPCVGHSLTWAAVWPYPVDLVYLDADHEYEAVRADIRAWLPKVHKGGILCGHDYNPEEFPGVVRAVEETLGPVERAGAWVWWKRV